MTWDLVIGWLLIIGSLVAAYFMIMSDGTDPMPKRTDDK